MISPPHSFKAKLFELGARLAKFAAGQSALQLVQAINGLVFVWLLPVKEFALYAVFTAAMGLAAVIVSLGVTPLMVSLVGPNTQDRAIVGKYLYAALRLRLYLLVPVGLVAVGFMAYSAWLMGCSAVSIASIGLVLLGAIGISAQAELLAAPLQMLGRLGAYYRMGIFAEVSKSVLIALLYITGALNALWAAVAVLVGLLVNFAGIIGVTRGTYSKPSTVPTKEIKELWHLALPILPNAVFGAFQGQMAIIVSATFGNTTQIAAVGALGRLSRILSFLQAANNMLLGPILAKLSADRFWRFLPVVLFLAGGIGSVDALSGVFIPDYLTLLLGANYRSLSDVMWLTTLGAGLSYFLAVSGAVTTFRGLVSWWASFATIGLVILAQVGVAMSFDLRTIAGALMLGVAANAARIVALTLVMLAARFRPAWLRDPKNVAT